MAGSVACSPTSVRVAFSMPHYLDFAATSAVRPPEVAEAVNRFLTECGATPGRGGHRRALEAGRVALACRKRVCALLGVGGDPGRLAFMSNATMAINTALWGLLAPGDVLVVTAFDHNAVLRPAFRLARHRGVEVRIVSGSADGTVDMREVEDKLQGARLLVVNAVSNVLGTVLPLSEMARLAHGAGALVLVDAAQSAGHLELECEADGADLVAFTGHKGLLGPQGVGGLWVREGVEVEPLLVGGSGGDSMDRDMPSPMPDRLEAGTVNGPGLAGLSAGCDYLTTRMVDDVHAHEVRLKSVMYEGLESLEGVRVVSPPAPEGVGIVTLVAKGVDSATLAERLDREYGVASRAGLHCAPEVHRILGTEEHGALRLSVGWCSTEEDVNQALRGVEAITGRRVVSVL